MSKISLNNFVPSESCRVLLDTNILIHIFYPTMSNSYMREYEKLYAKLLSKKSQLLLPAIQVSEFINRCIRFQFGIYKENHSEDKGYDFKKDYRNTQDYKQCMEAILDIVRNDILTFFTIINDNFEAIKQDKIFIYGFSYDFNDALLVQIAENENAAIVTHDSDFANYKTKVDIVTANKTLLKFS
ncbi:PIN domain-containing protein [Blautia sp.]|uniref:PIN domain-containing protein n=1 Tax=Blautia sp. TaxID=1955243 RepID=UPI0025837C81|nr:PIN domain-containing protein [Blautia sp.]